jgi:hypothetical protein
MWRPNFALATKTPLPHNAKTEGNHAFTIEVVQDARQPGRYRWSVAEDTKVRDTSFYSFATRREPKTTRTGSLKSSGPFGRPTNSGSYYCDGGGSGLLAAGGIDASHRDGPDEGAGLVPLDAALDARAAARASGRDLMSNVGQKTRPIETRDRRRSLRLVPTPRTAGVDVKRPLQIAKVDIAGGDLSEPDDRPAYPARLSGRTSDTEG